MRCAEISELMSLSLDGLATPDDMAKLDAHLTGCTECRVAWAALQEVSRMFATAGWVEPPPDFTQRVMARVEQQRAPLRIAGGLLLMAVSALASLLVMLPVLGLLTPRVQEALRGPAVATAGRMVEGIATAGRVLAGVAVSLLDGLVQMVPVPVLVLYPVLAILVALVWVLAISRAQSRMLA